MHTTTGPVGPPSELRSLLALTCHSCGCLQVKDGSWYTDKEANKRTRVTQYHSVITATTGRKWLGEFARAVNIVELLGLAVAQIIASASNFYSIDAGLNKRCVTALATC